MSDTTPIIFREKKGLDGDIGEITLNRPQALNALTLEMCRDLFNQLTKWAAAKHIKAVIIKGEGDRAFCAGGDIRLLYQHRENGLEQQRQFFWHEYRLNLAVYHFPKPYISFLDGLTMGGGAGISVHGSHRIGTENLQFAMPETKIGFYPDIGASYFLNQCPGKTGHYLGLTGNTIDNAQALELGLITHIVPRKNLEALENALTHTSFLSQDFPSVTEIINPFSIHPKPSELQFHRDTLDACFDQDSIESILSALKQNSHKWCHDIAETLLLRSPTSLKVVFEQLKRSAGMNFDDIMQMEFDMTMQFLQGHDFFEGVRAAVIDKDQSPKWQPKSLSEIKNADIAAYFKHKDQILNKEGLLY